MVALLAFIGFYIFGICCYKVCTGFFENTSNGTKQADTITDLVPKVREKNQKIKDKMHYLAVWYKINWENWIKTLKLRISFFQSTRIEGSFD